MAEPIETPVAPATGPSLSSAETNPKTPAFRAPEGAVPVPSVPVKVELKDLIGETREEYDARMAEFKKLRKERDDLAKQLSDIESAKLVEQGKYKELYEKEQTSRKQAEGRMREKLLRAEVRAYAIAEGILDPDMADLISVKSVKTNDETGEFENLKEAIAAHKAAKPQWYRSAAAVTAPVAVSTGSSSPAPSPGVSGPLDVKKMTKEAYESYKRSYIRGLKSAR